MPSAVYDRILALIYIFELFQWCNDPSNILVKSVKLISDIPVTAVLHNSTKIPVVCIGLISISTYHFRACQKTLITTGSDLPLFEAVTPWGFPDVFRLFGPCKVGAISFRYSWTTGMKKKFRNPHLKKSQISGLAQIDIFSDFLALGVANFRINYLRQFSFNFKNSCAHLAANFLNFLKHTQLFRFGQL